MTIESGMPEHCQQFGVLPMSGRISSNSHPGSGNARQQGNRVGPRVPGLFLPDDFQNTRKTIFQQHGAKLALAGWWRVQKIPDGQGDGELSLALPFGRGIVATPNDFGAQEHPTHPELLDWLATEFVHQKWSVKAMHRLMVMLQIPTKLPARVEPENCLLSARARSGNNLFWRYNRRRIEAEAVRDAVNVAGNFNPKAGGPACWSRATVLIHQLYKPQPVGLTADPSAASRRTIYLIATAQPTLPFMEAFDAPDLQNSCRDVSRAPLHCSARTAKRSFSNDQARVVCWTMLKEEGCNPNALGRRASACTGREPTAQENRSRGSFRRSSPSCSATTGRKEEVACACLVPETLDRLLAQHSVTSRWQCSACRDFCTD